MSDPRKPLTAKQWRFLLFVVEHWRKTQQYPEFREVMNRLSLKSLNSVSQMYGALEKKGYATYGKGGLYLLGLDPSQAAADYLARLPPPDED